MEHVESAIKVFYTRDYSRFRMINGNRQLNERKIKNIISDINNGVDVLRFCPVIVKENNSTLDLIDGQHRFYVSRRLKTPVWYIIAEDMSLVDIAKINSNTENWKAKDYINCYIQQDNTNYQLLQDLMDKFPVTVSDALSLLSTGSVSGRGRDKEIFQQGKFEAKHPEEADKILTQVSKFNFSDKYRRQFIAAIIKVIEGGKVDFKEFVNKINNNISELKRQATYKDYLTNLEAVFNKGKHDRVVIW